MNLARSSSVYLISTLAEKAIGFLILPLLTAKLLPEGMGTLSLVTTTYAFLGSFILISTSGAVFVEQHRSDDPAKFPSYFSTALAVNLSLFLFFMLVTTVAATALAERFDTPVKWVLAIPLFCMFDAVKGLALAIFQIRKQAMRFAFLSLVYTACNFGLSMWLVYSLNMDYEGRLGGLFFAGLAGACLSLAMMGRAGLLTFRLSKTYLLDILRYGLPLLPHAIGFLVLDLADRFFIDQYAGTDALGIYSTAYLISTIPYVCANSFSSAGIPVLYDELKKNTREADLRIVRGSLIYFLAMLIFAVAFCLCLPIGYRMFINKAYYAGTSYAWLIVTGYFFMSIYLLFSGIIFYRKKNYVFGYIAGLNIIITLSLNYFLVRRQGAPGAALATCISMFIFMAVIAVYSNRIKPLPWKAGMRSLFSTLKSTSRHSAV